MALDPKDIGQEAKETFMTVKYAIHPVCTDCNMDFQIIIKNRKMGREELLH